MTIRFLTIAAAAAVLVAVTVHAQSPLLLVLNKEDAQLAFVDVGSGKVIARVPTGEAPHELAVSADGKLAFASNYGAQTPGSSISVIDVASHKELRRVDVSPLRRPHGLWFADGKLYFTAEANRVVARYDPATGKVDWIMGTGLVGTHTVVANQDASRLFAANIGSDAIAVLERGANPLAWNETVIAVGKGPEALDLSPDGRELWTAHSRDGGVSIIDVASKKVALTIDLRTRRSNRLKFTPDGKLVLVSDLDAGELVVVDAASRKEVKRIPVGRMAEGILIPPDGARAYVAVAGDGAVAIVDLKTLSVSGKIETGRGPDGMGWVGR